MPTLNDLLNQHKDEIENEIKQYKAQQKTEITRNNDTRVWKAKLKNEIDFEEEKSKHIVPENKERKTEFSFGRAVFNRWKMGFLLLAILMAPTLIAVNFLPKNYFSVMYIYAPEKSDSIASRMTLFYNRVEFASFPTELKMPVSLLSKKLKQSEARNWVIKTYIERFSQNSTLPFSPESISAEVAYVVNTETLMIQGFANHPEVAMLITNLYGEYFQLLKKNIEDEHRQKIDEWFAQTMSNIDKQSDDIFLQLQNITLSPINKSMLNSISGRMSENANQIEMKLATLNLQRDELLRALKTTDFKEMSFVTDVEVQNLLKIREELLSRPETQQYSYRIDDMESQIRTLIQNKIQEKTLAIKTAHQDQIVVNKKLKDNKDLNSVLNVNQELESNLITQLNSLRSQKSELLKLKSQLQVELSSGNLDYKVVQPPLANENSLRPLPAVRYLMAIALVFLLVLLTLSAVEAVSRLQKVKST